MSSKANKQGKLMHYMLSPIRILTKATEFYMKSMADCAGRAAGHGAAVGCPVARVACLPNDDEVFRQLIRTVSKRNVKNKVSFNRHRQQEARKSNMDNGAMGRSYSVGLGKIGRIDVDKPCYFEECDVNACEDGLLSKK